MRCKSCNERMTDREAFTPDGMVEDLCSRCIRLSEPGDRQLREPTGNEAMTGLHPDWETYAECDLPIPDNIGATIDE